MHSSIINMVCGVNAMRKPGNGKLKNLKPQMILLKPVIFAGEKVSGDCQKRRFIGNILLRLGEVFENST